VTAERTDGGESADPGEARVGDAERFVPSVHRQTTPTPEHWARYGWAASLFRGATVLDAGCGVGAGTSLLADRAARAIGVDISAPAVAEAKQRHGGRADFLEGDLRSLPFEEQSFDVVVCFETIERLQEVDRGLDELRRVLRPEGLLLISSANRGVYPAGNPLHLSELTSEELRDTLAARFANVAVHRQNTYWASFLGGDSALREDDPRRPLEADVRKSTGGDPGSELYAVAVASDGELPPAPALVVLGGNADHEEQGKLMANWQERALQAETDAAAARIETEFAQQRERDTLARAEAAERALAEHPRARRGDRRE